ncbi:hypothetical protein C0995_005423 [Termitomyces sp. Mi166|nr:hypothetical protein C0995_005423 [Termitomyces sp. Mi166\
MSARPSPGPSARLKQPQPPVGIAAGAEDAKYQTKYRELKRKVKEIETDNDKLHFKVLQAKRSIQRMKLERAILYERLASLASPSDPQTRHGPPVPIQAPPVVPVPPPLSRSHSGNHQYQDMNDESPNNEYPIPHERPRMTSGYEMAPHPSVSHTPRMHSPPRRTSGDPVHESRYIQHMPPPLPGTHANSRPHVSPTMHHTHSNPSHERTRSQSSTRSREHQQPYVPGHPHQYPEGLPPVQQQVMYSPPIQKRERSRRHDNHEAPHVDPHQHSRLSSFMPRLSPPHDSRRVHGHPPMSPGPPSSREEYDYQRERELEHERGYPRDLGRNRDGPSSMVSPPVSHHGRQSLGRDGFRLRDEPTYYGGPPSGYAPHSRSGSPVSGSGSGNGNGNGGVGGDISRPDSRHYYEPHERGSTRAFKLRPVNPPNEEMDFVHEDGRSRDRGGGFEMSRKRGRNEMDVDDDAVTVEYTTGRIPEDRGKRYREHRRSIDNQDDGRMGPP